MNTPPIAPGSVAAQVLARVWSGAPGTIVAAAPGAGKSTLIAQIVPVLVEQLGLSVVVATPTREQAYALGSSLFTVMAPGKLHIDVKGASFALDPDVFLATRHITSGDTGRVVVRTVDSCRYRVPVCDLMVVDEAYQTTFAQLTAGAGGASQLLCVGDSGQIGPVIQADVSALDQWKVRPHHRAPDVLAERPDFATIAMGTTHRLGPVTTGVVAPLYDFPLTSCRPPRHIIGVGEVETVLTGPVSDINEHRVLNYVAERAAWLSRLTRVDGERHTPMTDDDVAVVLSRNTQVSLVKGLLDSLGHPGITVGSANKLQGGQWPAVVSVDPLMGVGDDDLAERDVSCGLLCVMASRSMHHLTWVMGDEWARLLDNPLVDPDDSRRGSEVRRTLASLTL